jgi:hypothetical protein
VPRRDRRVTGAHRSSHAANHHRLVAAPPELVTAGTFAGDGTLSMWSAADPARFKILQVTAEQPGDGTSTAKNGITQT